MLMFSFSLSGICHAQFETYDTAAKLSDCISLCANDLLCQWWTYEAPAQLCFLFEECPEVTNNCEDWITGQKDCQAPGI